MADAEIVDVRKKYILDLTVWWFGNNAAAVTNGAAVVEQHSPFQDIVVAVIDLAC